MRSFIRHPTDIPIEICPDETGTGMQSLRDISTSGLSLHLPEALAPGTLVRLRISAVTPPFEVRGRVVWCHREDGRHDVGIEFVDPDRVFQARMVEQICHIEQYRREVQEHEGRLLSGQEAAMEWIAKYAPEFPPLPAADEDR